MAQCAVWSLCVVVFPPFFGDNLCFPKGFKLSEIVTMFAAEIRRNRVSRMRSYSNWQWHLDEVFVKINGETHYLWRAVDHEGEVLESYVTKRRDRKAALKFLRKAIKRYGGPEVVVTALSDKTRLKRAGRLYGYLSQHVLLDAIQILMQIMSVEQGVSALCELEFSAFISAS